MLQQKNYLTPDELGIGQDLFDALIAVRDMLLNGKIGKYRFRMGVIRDDNLGCGTVGCIAGHCGIYMGMDRDATINAFCLDHLNKGSKIMALFYPTSIIDDELFCHMDIIDRLHDAYKATPAQGAQAIQNFLTTGKPEWEKVMG